MLDLYLTCSWMHGGLQQSPYSSAQPAHDEGGCFEAKQHSHPQQCCPVFEAWVDRLFQLFWMYAEVAECVLSITMHLFVQPSAFCLLQYHRQS